MMLPGKKIEWINGFPPVDEPFCGYRGEKCIVPPSAYAF